MSNELLALAAIVGSIVLLVVVGLLAFATWVFMKVDLSEDLGGDRWEDL